MAANPLSELLYYKSPQTARRFNWTKVFQADRCLNHSRSRDYLPCMRFGFGRSAQRPVFLLSFFLVTFIAGCSAGSGDGLNISGRPLSETADVPLAATLESIQSNVFDPSCIVCHAGANAPQGLRLDAPNSFTNLVGIRSRENGSVLRVAPGEPNNSYLVRKLEGTASVGERMPLGGPPIPQSTIDFVRQWITDGALADSTAPSGSAPLIVSLTPMPDSVGAFPAEIIVGFDRDMDASTINAMTFELMRSGGDGQFDDGNEEAILAPSISLSSMNARVAIMDLAGVAPVLDRYQVTLRGTGANVMLSVVGTALDGEYTGSLPSGDGLEGGDFVVVFDVQGLQPSLDSIQANIFSPTCAVAGCHTGPTGPNLPSGMDLSSANASFASLVNVASVESPTTRRVAAGDANNSYLIHKLEGSAAVGARMPFGGPFLEQSNIDVIRLWIDSGAAR